jgi:hypothetical protein
MIKNHLMVLVMKAFTALMFHLRLETL